MSRKKGSVNGTLATSGISGVWNQKDVYDERLENIWGAKGDPFPVGVILLFYGDNGDLTNWSLFGGSDDKLLFSADATNYTVGTNAVSSLTLTNDSVSNSGGHTGTAMTNGNCSASRGMGFSNSGTHTHTYSTSYNSPEIERIRLIKCDVSSYAPPNAAFLSTSDLTTTNPTLTYVAPAGTNFVGINQTNYGNTTGNSNITVDFTLNSAGAHNHDGTSGGASGGTTIRDQSRSSSYGAHTHTASHSFAHNLKAYYMSVWKAENFPIGIEDNVIAMYNGATPPSGWVACDGTNGTVDLRGYFIKTGTTTTNGNTEGSAYDKSSTTNSETSTTDGSHGHVLGVQYSDTEENAYHGSSSGTHSHSVDFDLDWVPAHYSLLFITPSSA